MATIRDIEKRISDKAVSLDSYIVSVTPAAEMRRHWGVTDTQMAERHIVFDEDENYVRRIVGSA